MKSFCDIFCEIFGCEIFQGDNFCKIFGEVYIVKSFCGIFCDIFCEKLLLISFVKSFDHDTKILRLSLDIQNAHQRPELPHKVELYIKKLA